MQDSKLFLCAQLVRVIAGRSAEVGQLEQISEHRCVLSVPGGVPVGTTVRMQCLECPAGKRSCRECIFRGRVEYAETDATLGCLLEVEFDGRRWKKDRWQPEHLIPVLPTAGSLSPAGG
ncbi:MAG TPA: hypothetical protein VMV57_01610 [Terracidiphilus sp.]|nr:hypothetical protein [Terracidiphilus sp.]